MHARITPRLIPTLIALVFSGTAAASGFQLLEQNASGIGNSYAGSAAVAENASTIFYNPAGMTKLQAHEYSLGLTAVTTSYNFSDRGSSVGGLATAGDGGDGGGTGYIPNAYFSWAIAKDWYLGLGIGAPFGLKTEYDKRWIGAAQSQMFDIKTINVNPSIAYKVNDGVSVGFGLDWQQIDATYKRLAGTGAGTTASVTGTLKLDDTAWGWNAGVLIDVSEKTKLGISYRSKMKYQTTGTSILTNDGTAGGIGTMTALNGLGATSKVKAALDLPDTFIVSFTHAMNDRYELLGDISWTGWSSIPRVDIYRTSGVANGALAQRLDTDFRDTWRVALGANYKIDNSLKLKVGVAYDQTPVQSQTTRLVSLPDNNRIWLSAGSEWKIGNQSRLDVGLAYLFVKDAKINNNQSGAVPSRGTVTGSFEDSAWLLGAQFSNAF